jgi:hypothetical protein
VLMTQKMIRLPAPLETWLSRTTPAVTIVLIYKLPEPHCVSLFTADTQKKNSTKFLLLAGHYWPRGEDLND